MVQVHLNFELGHDLMKHKIIFLFTFFFVGCSTHNCHENTNTAGSTITKNVFVYKYDGTLQCGLGKEISLDQMQTELKGIQVFSKFKKKDGLMRTQVCGSNTGMANVFQIPADKLQEALKRGFDEWTEDKQ